MTATKSEDCASFWLCWREEKTRDQNDSISFSFAFFIFTWNIDKSPGTAKKNSEVYQCGNFEGVVGTTTSFKCAFSQKIPVVLCSPQNNCLDRWGWVVTPTGGKNVGKGFFLRNVLFHFSSRHRQATPQKTIVAKDCKFFHFHCDCLSSRTIWSLSCGNLSDTEPAHTVRRNHQDLKMECLACGKRFQSIKRSKDNTSQTHWKHIWFHRWSNQPVNYFTSHNCLDNRSWCTPKRRCSQWFCQRWNPLHSCENNEACSRTAENAFGGRAPRFGCGGSRIMCQWRVRCQGEIPVPQSTRIHWSTTQRDSKLLFAVCRNGTGRNEASHGRLLATDVLTRASA